MYSFLLTFHIIFLLSCSNKFINKERDFGSIGSNMPSKSSKIKLLKEKLNLDAVLSGSSTPHVNKPENSQFRRNTNISNENINANECDYKIDMASKIEMLKRIGFGVSNEEKSIPISLEKQNTAYQNNNLVSINASRVSSTIPPPPPPPPSLSENTCINNKAGNFNLGRMGVPPPPPPLPPINFTRPLTNLNLITTKKENLKSKTYIDLPDQNYNSAPKYFSTFHSNKIELKQDTVASPDLNKVNLQDVDSEIYNTKNKESNDGNFYSQACDIEKIERPRRGSFSLISATQIMRKFKRSQSLEKKEPFNYDITNKNQKLAFSKNNETTAYSLDKRDSFISNNSSLGTSSQESLAESSLGKDSNSDQRSCNFEGSETLQFFYEQSKEMNRIFEATKTHLVQKAEQGKISKKVLQKVLEELVVISQKFKKAGYFSVSRIRLKDEISNKEIQTLRRKIKENSK